MTIVGVVLAYALMFGLIVVFLFGLVLCFEAVGQRRVRRAAVSLLVSLCAGAAMFGGVALLPIG